MSQSRTKIDKHELANIVTNCRSNETSRPRTEINKYELADLIAKTEQASGRKISVEMLEGLPANEDPDFWELALSTNLELCIPYLPDVILVRNASPDENTIPSNCVGCVWHTQSCFMIPDDGYEREMPCDVPNGGPRLQFKAYRVINIAPVGKGKREYIPDTESSFDIPGTWQSVKTMIGM